MPSCREVARLVASGDLGQLGRIRQAMVRLHLATCDHCARYSRELKAIGAAARRLFGIEPLDPARMESFRRAMLETVAGDPNRNP